MVTITLPDGSKKNFPQPLSGIEIAKSISPLLAKKAVAVKIGDKVEDLTVILDHDADIKIITFQDVEGLDILRHSATHIMAQAVKILYPEAQLAIGPVIKDGFYYDFLINSSISTDDFSAIEGKMQEIIESNLEVTKEVWPRQQAIEYFSKQGENFKVEIIASIPEAENITVYKQGNFVDLCRGPHLYNTSQVAAFKLLKVSGAYWRGDAKNLQLQRIYGTAWPTSKQLIAYLNFWEEAEKRDHRKIGKELELFHMQEEAVGEIFWHEKGYIIFKTLQAYIREKLKDDYAEVKTPILVDRKLWEKSGHWEKFKENMFVSETEHKTFAIKPMSCPCHVQIFNHGLKTYKELPLRLSEFGSCHRNEPSGSLHGLMRVRAFTQDDAHIFCTEEQVMEESLKFCDLLREVYAELGFKEVKVKFSDRPEVRAGEDKTWDKAEEALKKAVIAANIHFEINAGEGAFYGPKLEFVLTDAIGREWQCGTLQMDFILPQKLSAFYIAADGKKYHPIMLHRAILGTFERFIGILLENYSGKLPLWLAPWQVAVVMVTDKVKSYEEEVFHLLQANNIRSVRNKDSSKTLDAQIRYYSTQKVPYIWVLGMKEATDRTVSLRRLGSKHVTILDLNAALLSLKGTIKNKL